MSDHDWQSAPTNSDFHTGCTSIPSQNHPGNIKGGLIVAQWEHNGGAHWSNCRPFPPYSWNSPWTCSGKHENVAIPNDSHMNWLQLRLMTKSVTSLMKFPKKRNTLMIKSVTSLMKFPKDRNTLTTKSVNSLITFPKDQNIFTNNLKNVTSLMFHYQITQGVLRVDS